MEQQTANDLNTLSDFLGVRDLPALTREALRAKYGVDRADLLILFGGSIAQGCDLAGRAVADGIAAHFMIVGGEGHTTESLRQVIGRALPDFDTAGKAEADVMAEYLRRRYEIGDPWLERRSTNCGSNVTNALAPLRARGFAPKTVLLLQDLTMQRRMDAGFRKHWAGAGVTLINYATYRVRAAVENGEPVLRPGGIWGMWPVERFISLLLGEIPRLTDDENGYGPNGKGYIAHVEVPEAVLAAFGRLRREFPGLVRAADPRYASGPAAGA